MVSNSSSSLIGVRDVHADSEGVQEPHGEINDLDFALSD